MEQPQSLRLYILKTMCRTFEMFGWILLATFWTLLPIALINYIAFEFGLGFGSKEGVKLLWIAVTCAVIGLVNSFMLFITSEVCFDLLVKKLKKGVQK